MAHEVVCSQSLILLQSINYTTSKRSSYNINYYFRNVYKVS